MRIKRIFLITVDCLRADCLSYVGGGKLTPNMDKMARESLVFTRAFANGPGTIQSFPAILTSTYFLMHGGVRLLPHHTTLADVLSEHGFRTAAFHSNPFLSKSLGWDKGFDEFYDFMHVVRSPGAFAIRKGSKVLLGLERFLSSGIVSAGHRNKVQHFLKKVLYRFSGNGTPYLGGKKLNEHVIGWVNDNLDGRFFLWMHYMDPHYPYVPPQEYLSGFSSREEALRFNVSVDYKRPSEEEVKILRDLYMATIRFTDACLGEFFNFLRDDKLMENSLILLMGDHGHAFMEHGDFGHAYDVLYNEVLHVPLMIYGPFEHRTVGTEVQLLDVPPTILSLVGIGKAPSFMGQSLFDAERAFTTIFSESAESDLINLRYDTSKRAISCIHDKKKLIMNELRGTIELYDLEKDFQEKENIVETQEEIYSELAFLIKSHLSYEESRGPRAECKDAENEIKERLRSLGYI